MPLPVGNPDINTCHDPECGKFGLEADLGAQRFLGPNAQTPAPAHLIEGALPTEATLANVLVAKHADHMPLY